MNSSTLRQQIAGPAGQLECAIDAPASAADGQAVRGVAVICHPNPTQGGTLDNKVVQTLARALVQLGYRTVRFNFRGIGRSEGAWDEGRGEVDDCLAVVHGFRVEGLPLVLAGFSFGGFVASRAAQQLPAEQAAERLLLVGPATSRFDTAPVPADTVVIHGEVDDVVPLSAVLDWARPQSLPVTVVPGVGHFFHGQLPLLKNIVLRSWHAA
ncbi:MAG: alpha/beta fold hydrolase [Burkholderiaceae bacterium]|nr:alpha/beta fold hydrolase [Roseateles sp.]MBV8468776.1 alpha/beta fold hydrolase [Burkholderiaceae bacterium]